MASRHVTLANRCSESKSPYVRSHMDNPTAWQLWSPQTLELARASNRLLFVSIGYSACHWCHVMAHESFMSNDIAQLLNENFIPVKIDREERPDIDRQYMDFLQATTGGGGWPLNVFVTPDLHPIFGGTYWPSAKSERGKHGTSFEDILQKVATLWKDQEERVRENGRQITTQLRDFAQEGSLGGEKAEGGEDGLDLDVIEDAYQHYKKRFDSVYGGFGTSPKFPTPVHLRALLRFGAHNQVVRDIVGDEDVEHAKYMAVKTLECMAKGGIKDQIGHGFARYSVTRDWSLPHFEKMLYDNAQLLHLYLDAWLVTKKELFLEMVHDIATYLTTEPMQSSLGGINASEDADSLETEHDHHKLEGAFYVFSMDEFEKILTEGEVKVCAKYWNVQSKGNVDRRYDHQGELVGKNTLCVMYDTPDLAKELNVSDEEPGTASRSALSHEQAPRSLPPHHNKPNPTSKKAAQCIKEHLFDPSTNTLHRVYRDGPGETKGFADDYAFLISGLLDLYETTFDDSYLQFADTLQQTQIKLFWDTKGAGAFFSTPADQPDILVRTKDGMDNAEPSTNGVSAQNLFRLGSVLNDESYEKMGKRTVCAFEVEIGQHPGLFTGMMSSVIASELGMRGLMVVGEGPAVEATVRLMREGVRPNMTVLRVGGGAKSEWLRGRNELLKDLDGKREMVQVCEGGTCRLLDEKGIEALLGE
ncbi:hypothetical protein LTS02_009536 [Friedmanniomyces endolithicus]|nr:hypothetical protein LTS02_009536 [Friedmanniomyces endolithicus]